MWRETDAVVELYLLIFLCGAGGVREGFGKEVGKEEFTEWQEERTSPRREEHGQYRRVQGVVSAGRGA